MHAQGTIGPDDPPAWVAVPFVSVILPAGRSDRVGVAVDSLLEQSFLRSRYEILVVTPEPEALEEIADKDVRLVSVPKLYPPGRMRNIGAARAKGEILCFFDDDCLAPDDWLESMERVLLMNDHAGAVGCRVTALEQTWWNRCADHALFTAYQGVKSGWVAGLGSAALAVRREAFEAVGGFDETLLASEDWDFSLRLNARGWQCWFVPTIEVLHDHRRGGFIKILRAVFRSGYLSGLTVQRRHYSDMAWLARLMVRAGHPAVYWLVMLPYAMAATLLWAMETRPTPGVFFSCLPMVFLARCAYQFGVWRKLCGKRHSNNKERK